MSRRLHNITGGLAVVLASSALTFAQTQTQPTTTTTTPQPTQTTVTTTTTQATQNPDGTWTVVEYPVNKEVIVQFTPDTTVSTAKGRAKVMRMGDHTMVNVDLSGLPATATGYNVYAVDPFGKATLLGPIAISNGAGAQQYKTGLDRFMLVLSPNADLKTYEPTTSVAFRSAVPEGFAVVPLSHSDREAGAAIGEKVSATTTSGATSGYNVPMLKVAGMKRGEDTQVKVNFTGAMTGARANFNIEPRKDGPTMITARFHELKEAPAGQVYVLWAVSPDNKFVKLGQIVNTGGRNEAEIKSETTLPEFGLLVTAEEETAMPRGAVVGTIIP